MRAESIEDLKEKRNLGLRLLIAFPLLMFFMNGLIGPLSSDELTESVRYMEVLMELLYAIVILAVSFGLVTGAWFQLKINMQKASQKTSNSTKKTDSVLETINTLIPDFSFGTYRYVRDFDVSGHAVCQNCTGDATMAREYQDAAVRFGIALER